MFLARGTAFHHPAQYCFIRTLDLPCAALHMRSVFEVLRLCLVTTPSIAFSAGTLYLSNCCQLPHYVQFNVTTVNARYTVKKLNMNS